MRDHYVLVIFKEHYRRVGRCWHVCNRLGKVSLCQMADQRYCPVIGTVNHVEFLVSRVVQKISVATGRLPSTECECECVCVCACVRTRDKDYGWVRQEAVRTNIRNTIFHSRFTVCSDATSD